MRLVVVEDKSRLALLLKRGFEEQGYVVDVTGNGAERLRLASEANDDMVVLDVMLPSVDGLEVTRRLRALVRRGQVERPAVLEVGELRLDPAHRQAWRGQQQLELSPKEFALLELFLAHPGEVLTRTRILEHVWDFAFDPASQRGGPVRRLPAPQGRPPVRPGGPGDRPLVG